MRAALAMMAALLWQAGGGTPDPGIYGQRFSYERVVAIPGSANKQACAVLDGDVFANAGSGTLNDLRLSAYGGGPVFVETPFARTRSGTEQGESRTAIVRNARISGGDVVFDLAMPEGPYTAVVLDMDAKDFAGSAHVFGIAAGASEVRKTDLGTFAVFDFNGQHLSRSTTLSLQESTFPELEVELHLTAVPVSQPHELGPAIVRGAMVPPSREAQELFTVVAQTPAFVHRGHESVATLHVPAHVPVERTSFTIDPGYRRNFLRSVTVKAIPESQSGGRVAVETVGGDVSRVTFASSGRPGSVAIDESRLSVESVLGANLRGGATVEIAIEDGEDGPLPVTSVRLEMRQQKICFDARIEAEPYVLFYGDQGLRAPVYAYSRNFIASANAIVAVLGPEIMNPTFAARRDARPYWERHPELVWVGLLMAIGILGSMLLRAGRRRSPAHRP